MGHRRELMCGKRGVLESGLMCGEGGEWVLEKEVDVRAKGGVLEEGLMCGQEKGGPGRGVDG